MINLLEIGKKKKIIFKVFTYPRSSALKFASQQVDPYSHRATIANDRTQSCTKDENSPPLPITYDDLLDRDVSRTDNRNGTHFTDNPTAHGMRDASVCMYS